MIEIKRTNSDDADLPELIKQLDEDLAVTDGDEHAFYDQFNKIDSIKYVVILYQDNRAVSCGALKEFTPGTMEIKRMFTLSNYRGRGFAGMVLRELEEWARELNYNQCILETGVRQPDAIALYKKNGYEITPNYGQYIGIKNSLCFARKL